MKVCTTSCTDNDTGQYEDFQEITHCSQVRSSQAFSRSATGKPTTYGTAYDTLSCFTDVDRTMKSLETASHKHAVVFSRGIHNIIFGSVNNGPDLSKDTKSFEDIVVVEEVTNFMPHQDVYYHRAKYIGKDTTDKKQIQQIWVVSRNPFDLVSATAVGMNTI